MCAGGVGCAEWVWWGCVPRRAWWWRRRGAAGGRGWWVAARVATASDRVGPRRRWQAVLAAAGDGRAFPPTCLVVGGWFAVRPRGVVVANVQSLRVMDMISFVLLCHPVV